MNDEYIATLAILVVSVHQEGRAYLEAWGGDTTLFYGRDGGGLGVQGMGLGRLG